MLLYHIVRNVAWEKSLNKGIYKPESLEKEGFIHFSTKEQLLQSATLFFKEDTELVVLEVPAKRMKAHLKWEEAGGGLFPHYYAKLPIELVENTQMLIRNVSGDWEIV